MTVTATRRPPPGGSGGSGGPLPPGSPERKKAVKRYFKRSPDSYDAVQARRLIYVAVALGLLAGALVLVGMGFLAALVAVIAIMTGMQGWMQLREYERRFRAAEPKPDHRTMDLTLEQDLRRLSAQAMIHFGLMDTDLLVDSDGVHARRPLGAELTGHGQGPPMVFGPAKRSTGRPDLDGVWRFTAYDVLVVCATARHLAIYTCTLDFASGGVTGTETHEFDYEHIVAVLIRSRPGSELSINLMEPGLRVSTADEFQVVVASGDRSHIAVRLRDDNRAAYPIRLQESGADNVVAALGFVLARPDQ